MTGEKSHRHIHALDQLEKDLDERVRRRAFEIWLEEGKPQGRELDHWFRAQQQVTSSADELKLAEGEITSLSESD